MTDKSKWGKEEDYDEMSYNPHLHDKNNSKRQPAKPVTPEYLKYLEEQAEDAKTRNANPK